MATGDDSTNDIETYENLESIQLIKDEDNKSNKIYNETNWSGEDKKETKECDLKKKKKVDFNLIQDDHSKEAAMPSSSSSSANTYKNRIIGTFRKLENPVFLHHRLESEIEIAARHEKTARIMGSLQLGIHYSIGKLVSKPERDLLMNDFMLVESTTFAAEGSNCTPAHNYSQFVFKTYAPTAFRYFRELFRIPTEDYLLSFCKNPLNELPNTGSSGSLFYVTNDDKFIMKTIQSRECDFLQKLLPGYYMNLHQNPKTLLPKFFGLYFYKCETRKIRFVAMNNVLPSQIKLHQKFDLKGSTYKRKANKKSKKEHEPLTYKDLDFSHHHQEGIYLDDEIYHELMKTIERDCRVLESFKIMDYSLLLGIHIIDKEKVSLMPNYEQLLKENTMKNFNCSKDTKTSNENADTLKLKENKINPLPLQGGIPAKTSKGEKLLIFIGIIDILQSYRLVKKLEHSWKSIIHNGDTISVHNPAFYSQRFRKFLSDNVFKKLPATSTFKSRNRSISKMKSLSLPSPTSKK